MAPDDSWEEWRRYVLEELKDLNRRVEELRAEVQSLREFRAEQKVKSGVYGFVGAALPVVMWFLFMYIRGLIR